MSGEKKGRHEPDGKEDGIDSSLNLTATQSAPEGTAINQNEAVEASTNREVTPINNQLSDDSLEDDAVPDNPVAANVARDNKVNAGHSETNTENSDLLEAVNQSKEVTVHNGEQGKITDEGVSPDNNGGHSVTPLVSSDVANESDNVKKEVSKVTASGRSLQNSSLKLSQSSSRFSTSSSRIPVLKGSKGKPSPLLEPHKASMSSVTMTTPGEFPQQEVNSPALRTSESTDTPISVALQEIPSSDSLHQDVDKTGDTRKETHLFNKQKGTTVTTQAYRRGWDSQKYSGRPSQLPVPVKRRRELQDGGVVNNSNSFNSYVHEQMAITMAMMEANFAGVGLSNRQQERVEELRAGLDSFSLTNITAPMEEQKTVFKNSRNHHDNRSYRDAQLSEQHYDLDDYGTRASHDNGMQLYRGHSYSIDPNHLSYGSTVHDQRRGSHTDSFGVRRSGSYLQQQLDRRGSYQQQSKLAQSIKSLRPPKLKPLPRKRSYNYLQSYMKSSNSNRQLAAGRVSNRQWSPAHVMPPLDESTPLGHTNYLDPTLGNHMIYDGNYGNGCYYSKQHQYPVLPNIGDSYSSVALHSTRPYNSYQQQCPGPPHGAAAHPRGQYYTEHDHWRHRS